MSEMKNYRILCLFTCFNRLEKTRRCITSLKSYENIHIDFIAVDDASRDGTPAYLKQEPDVMCLEGSGNLFYTGGMNMAMNAAMERIRQGETWDYVMLVNDDVLFYDHAVTGMIDSLGGECAVIAGCTDDGKGNYTYGGIIKRSNWRPKYRQAISEESMVRCDTFNANCVLIPFEIFRSVPVMDGFYQHEFGDYDYGLSITRAGYPIYASRGYVGMCEDDHSPAGSWNDRSLPVRKRLQLKESVKGLPFKIWFYYLKKNYGIASAVLFSITPFIRILLRK